MINDLHSLVLTVLTLLLVFWSLFHILFYFYPIIRIFSFNAVSFLRILVDDSYFYTQPIILSFLPFEKEPG
jgi:hypothetical protein